MKTGAPPRTVQKSKSFLSLAHRHQFPTIEGFAASQFPSDMTPLFFEHGVYRTPPQRPSLLARWFPSLAFYSRYVRIVFRSAGVAKRSLYDDLAWSTSSLEVMRALERVGVQFEITGVEHLQRLQTPCVVVANHMSTLETAVLPAVIQPIRNVTFVVKQALLHYPIFKYVMRSRNPIAVTTNNAREDFKIMMTEGAERLSRGISVVVFPEGARRHTFDPAEFNTIGIKLAQRAGVPILPLALVTDAWPLGRPLSDFGKLEPSRKVRFAFASPIEVAGRGADEQQAIIRFIMDKLATWHSEDHPAHGLAALQTTGIS